MKKVLVLLLLGVCVFAVGCSKKKGINDGLRPGAGTGSQSLDFADEPSLRGDFDKDTNLKAVLFEFDRSDLGQEALSILKENAAHIINNPKVKVVVEGHCDERGTIEYNLALGQRRAVKVKEYYTQLGIEANRIATISYGKEKPVDPRNTEAAWAKNRRAETKVLAQ